jgi:hypothetical protein
VVRRRPREGVRAKRRRRRRKMRNTGGDESKKESKEMEECFERMVKKSKQRIVDRVGDMHLLLFNLPF